MSNLQTINELQPIARELRERQEQIEHKLRQFRDITADLVIDASDQGRAIVLAKTKLGKSLRWGEWLNLHVPNLTEEQAAKYERIATEQLADPRQCVFAFLPPAEREEKPARAKPAMWEQAWGYVAKFVRVATFEQWPTEQVELTRRELEPVAKRLWPEKF